MTDAIRVAIVDDHAIVRKGLRTLLQSMNMDVVGEAACGNEAVELAQAFNPDVMLLDIRMKECDGLHALPEIKDASPATQVIILTTYSNPAYLSEAIRKGAAGYLLKESEPTEIVSAIEAAAARRHLFDPELLNKVVNQDFDEALTNGSTPSASKTSETKANGADSLIEPMTDREHDVLSLLAQGMSNADIASELQVSVTTVKTHVTHILRKLNVNDRTQAVLVAIRLGLVE